MRVRGALQVAALLASALWATPLLAKKDRPTVHTKIFEHIPKNLNYFTDSDVVVFQDTEENNVYRSEDAGVKWDRVDAVPKGEAWLFVMHDFDPKRAYILTEGSEHFRTSDRGKTWQKFDSDAELSMFRGDILQFNAGDPDRILFNGMTCQGIFCQEVAMYTTDGFKSKAKLLRQNTDGCWWAKGTALFTTGEDDLDKDRVLCIARDTFSPFKQDQRLVISDNFFKGSEEAKNIQEFEPNLDKDKAVQGIVSVANVKKFILVATTSVNTDEMALFVTTDTKKWHRTIFPAPHDSHDHRLMQEAYTVLESTDYSIQIDVMTSRPSNPMGVIFTSTSNGIYYSENKEHTNRNRRGHVDFEKIADIQGIFMVNSVKNWKEVESKGSADKEVVTEITFDDGRTFEKITADGDRLHLHSVTELRNVGRVFSSPAPGLVMGVGNTGDYLESYPKGNLYVSDDAGKTWTKALKGPHKYEFGDQGSILVAVADTGKADVKEFKYSIDHGLHWETESLPDDVKIQPFILTTSQDSASLKFILTGSKPGGEDKDGKTKEDWYIITIDFDGLHEDTCKDSNLEEWHARVDKDGKPTCLMGHTQSFQRRKKKAECFLKQEFKHLKPKTEDCDCTDLDFECDFNFERDDDGKCVARGPIVAPKGACKDAKSGDTFKGTSGYRKIPGNTCKDTKETKEKYKEKEWPCSEAGGKKPSAPATDKVEQTKTELKDYDFLEKHYLERGDSSSSVDETVIMRGWSGKKPGPIQISDDQGKTWRKPKDLEDEDIEQIISHQYFKDMVFFITSKKKVIYSTDRGKSFHDFEAPTKFNPKVFPFAFHPDKKNWLIWMGKKCEHDSCYMVASYTRDRGDHWETAARYVRHCEFTGASSYKYPERKAEQILCLKHEDEDKDKGLVLVTTNDWFKNVHTQGKNVKDFATMSEFIVVASEDTEKKTLRATASLDGLTYADAKFPYGFNIPHQHVYTVLDSSAHAVNLFVAVNTDEDREYGSILKSNSNGTSYVLSVSNVNANAEFFVDYEKMLGVEGVALVNVVANPDAKKGPKKLQTKITHSDGSMWGYIAPPKNDDIGKFSCQDSKGTDKCALHIHGYSERPDRMKTYSSNGAIGLMFGWGNVGDSLGPIKDADTFMTTDAGITWKRVRKGQYTWAVGDQGGVLLLAKASYASWSNDGRSGEKTKSVFYSLDGGNKWEEHPISDEEVELWDITTVRSGGSRSFLLWGKDKKGAFTLKVDFDGFSDRDCKFYKDDLAKSDYELWSAKHPDNPGGCLFGHINQFLRKKPDAKCRNDLKLQPLYGKQNCTCTRQDYECDYNFELDPFSQCKLVKGYQPKSKAEWCAEHPDAVDYFKPSGYRRIPLTTCIEGVALDQKSQPESCTGKEEEFKKKHRTSWVAIFFAVVIPIAIASGAGWYVWRNWNGKFGQIRLGDNGSSAFDSDQPWVKYPVIVLSAVVAVVGAIPVVAAVVWRSLKGLAERSGLLGGAGGSRGSWTRVGGGGWGGRSFTTRDSFARGSSDYSIVDEDEGELLGEDDSEEEV
ncbi:hypothetical protein QBC43DRAFT_295153 [Cladorrhinum sp. PSN259]|nr:hypothetical protein QBC43DRAFT_295153 [Cladorrhinum sp. PSN259]